MARKNRKDKKLEAGFKAGITIICLIALGIGGMHGFVEALVTILLILFFLSIGAAAIWGLYIVLKKAEWLASWPIGTNQKTTVSFRPRTASFVWTKAEILSHLERIDWYQFEKFCAATLEAEGFEVDRQGGASPDGGVDLIAQKNQTRTLIQCKHWHTWKIREPVIRQLLGSMVDFKVNKGAVFFSGESTAPAKEFAAKHGIGLVDGSALAERALKALPRECLDRILKCKDHHCPKCDSIMIWRTGDFKPFLGCSRFPKCRGVLKDTGAR